MVTLRRGRRVLAMGIFGVLGSGCRPDLNQTVSIVTTTQILAVRSDPAEAAPKGTVQYTALVADSSGPLSVPIDWAFCNARKPLAELGPVNPLCLQAVGDWFVPIGSGNQVTGALPDIACKQFGPDVPQPQPGQPAGRPVDPDQTGGYYQPARILVPGAPEAVIGLTETRLSCGVAGTPDQVVTFTQHYIPNVNPVPSSLATATGSLKTDAQGDTNPVRAGDTLDLTVSWATCPVPTGVCGDQYCDLGETKNTCPSDCATLAGCPGAETYVVLDLNTHALVTVREGIDVAWFATAGSFDNDRTGRAPGDSTDSSTNKWHAPTRAGKVHLWVILRDDRGGAGWTQFALDVQ